MLSGSEVSGQPEGSTATSDAERQRSM